MNSELLENDLNSLVEAIDEESFIFDLLLAYGQPKASITRLRKGDYNLSKNPGELLWKKKLFFKKETESDLHGLIDQLKNNEAVTKQQPRFLVVTDFETLLAVDAKTEDTLDIPIQELPKHYDFFLPWAGLEKTQLQGENPADIKAAERMGRLYDLILENNPPETEADRHALNIFLSRLLFCFFAEDTDIFEADLFTNSVASHTADDGSNLQDYLQKLFGVLSTEDRSEYPAFLQKFPYVNGGLFADEYPVPTFKAKSRKIIIECGGLNWKAINPDIFGSMIQAVIHPDQRGGLGIHYTSVVNIMKVIEPLFLNDLKDELEQAATNKKKLEALLERIYHLRIFDPACGSGNFLIIAYKELCKLEIEIFKRLQSKQHGQKQFRFESKLQLTQFYGIELDDFAHETAKLSLWLAEHQMNVAFKAVFGATRPTLPLQDGGHIVCSNATRLEWEDVCPKDEEVEIYVLGNPPYLGYSVQAESQKEDLADVLTSTKGFKSLDYISCWFMKGAGFIKGSNIKLAFVSTNSICQGEQVALLWPQILSMQLEIGFAYQSFKWSNNAKGNAGVTCVVIGLRNRAELPKLLFQKNGVTVAENINPYLVNARNAFVAKRRASISELPKVTRGSSPVDGGNLILTEDEHSVLLKSHPEVACFIRKFIGSHEFIHGKIRYCLLIPHRHLASAMEITPLAERVELVRDFRLRSKKAPTREKADVSYEFGELRHKDNDCLVLPRISSERREYIPIGFAKSDTVVSDLAFAIYEPPNYIFSVISSKIHMTWVRAVAGRMKTDYRYSSVLCYNTFPFPKITEKRKSELEQHVFAVLDQREAHSEKTLAELYDPDKMPEGLRKAHHEMDLAVEQCYRKKPFTSDEQRLEYLFKLYEKMIETEKKAEDANA